MSVNTLRMMWQRKTGERLPKVWDAAFQSWIEAYGMSFVEDAIQRVVADTWDPETETRKTPNIRDVPRYATVYHAEEAEPGMRDCYLVRGRIRRKFYVSDDVELLGILRDAMRSGMSAAAMHGAVTCNETFEGCCADLGVGCIEFKEIFGGADPLPVPDKVFIREDEPEWRLWDAYLRRTTGKGAPMNRRFGWLFPSRLPPCR
jgi:hypothetical protein